MKTQYIVQALFIAFSSPCIFADSVKTDSNHAQTATPVKKIAKASKNTEKKQRIPQQCAKKPKGLYQKTFKPKEVPVPVISQKIKNDAQEALIKRPIRDLSLDELWEAKTYVKKQGNNDLAITFLEQFIIKNNSQSDMRLQKARLEIADLYFDKGNLKKAKNEYRKFKEFYPGSKETLKILGEDKNVVQYSEYKELLCRFYARLKPPLDQTKTRKTIALANVYLDRTGTKDYEKEVVDIRHTCYQDLYEYEFDIFKQYVNLERFTAAQNRLESIKEEFLPLMPEIEPILIEQEGIVAQKQGKDTVVAQKIEELGKKFPTYSPTLLLTAKKPKKSFVDIF